MTPVRWWPMLYAAGWAMFAVFATEPRLFGTGDGPTRVLAGVGAVMLVWMSAQPWRRRVRLNATVVAAAFPLYRFFTLAWEPLPFPIPTSSRVVAMTAWALLSISLVVLYPLAWYTGTQQEQARGIRRN